MTPSFSLGESYDRSMTAVTADEWRSWMNVDLAEAYAVGLVIRPLRVFAKGDVVVDHIANGQGERWSFSGWSSKRRATIRGLYLPFGRFTRRMQDGRWQSTFHDNRTPVWLFVRPAEFANVSWTQPALREHALRAFRAAIAARSSARRAAHAACPVSTDSGAVG